MSPNSSSSSSNIEISKNELRFPLDSAISNVTIRLRHLGRTEDSVAFKVHATHEDGYLVEPQEGILHPNSSITLQVTFQDEAREKIHKIHEMFGQAAVNMDETALQIYSRNAATTDEFHKKINDELWKVSDQHTIKIHHYIELKDDMKGSFRIPGCPRAFPRTHAVKSCYDEILAENNTSTCEKCGAALCALIGILCAYLSSMMIGILPLILGLESLLYLFVDQGQFVKELQKFDQQSKLVEGRVVLRNKQIDDVSDKVHYFVRLEYDAIEEGDGVVHTTRVANYSSEVVSHHAKELFEMTERSSVVPMKVLLTRPESAIPTFLLDDKIKVSLRWGRFMHPLRGIFGLLIYLGFTGIWPLLFPIPAYIIISCALGGIIFMIPLCLSKVKNKCELKRRLVQKGEPESIPTENDAHQHFLFFFLGRSPSRRLKVISAIVGAFVCVVSSPPLFILLFVFGFLPLISLPSANSRLKLLKCFGSNSVPGIVCSHRRKRDNDNKTTEYYGTIQYEVLRYGNLYALKKEFKGERWYNNVGKRVNVDFLPDHPRSGYPRGELSNMLRKEFFHSRFSMPSSILIGFILYFAGHWIVYTDSAFFGWIITAIAPILVIPQLLVWGKKDYHDFQEKLLNGAEVVSCRKRSAAIHNQGGQGVIAEEERWQLGQITQHISKAIPLAETEHDVSPLSDGSSRTVATELSCVDNIAMNTKVGSLELV